MNRVVLGAAAVIAAAWLLILPVSDTRDFVRPVPVMPTPTPEPRASIIFGGDLMFDRSIRTAMEQHGEDYIFSCIEGVLQSADLVVANLEGPITTHPSKSIGTKVGGEGNYTFTFPISAAALLFRHNVRLVNIGNNHVMNFGREGLAQTKYWLDEAGVLYFGEPDLSETDRVERISVNGIPFSFVNWSDWTSDKTDHTVAQVREEAEKGNIVVVFAHWGDEYVPAPERVKVLARQFVDAGADIVIGAHPHVVQEHEIYQEKHIYYSLGNFVFDQYWSEAVRRGLLLRVEFTRESVASVEEIPIDNQTDRRTCAG
ncbi:CapA family protein [Candidatus Kaiserbacteria bacterium]|nr:CapA family protein [Candidatus Kaiserbacteria bacterium]